MTENEIASIVVDTCLMIHREWGPGLLESVYEEVLAYELKKRGLVVERQRGIEVEWDGQNLGKGFVADLIIDSLVIIELKSVQKLEPVHFKQLLTYLRLADLKLGLLINFNETLIKNGIKRVVNGL
jgi:GxxExxY protein